MTLRHRVLQLLSGSNSPHFWCRRFLAVILVLFIVHLLPKPECICGRRNQRTWAKVFVQDANKAKQSGAKAVPANFAVLSKNVVLSESTRLLNMFPMYQLDVQENNAGSSRQDADVEEGYKPSVNIFHLENFNFRNFSQKWVNVNQNRSLEALWNRIDESVETEQGRRVYYAKLQQQQLLHQGHLHQLPQCVTLRGLPAEARRTKICVHPPHVDNFISNRLRDFGTWENIYTSQMVKYFQGNPQSQLLDIGCNVGVFTLHAASVGIPVVAVDIIPANLALIQVSIAVNDGLLDALDEDAFVNQGHPEEDRQDSKSNRRASNSVPTNPPRTKQKQRILLNDVQDKYIKDNLQWLFHRRKLRKVKKGRQRVKRSTAKNKSWGLYSELITTLHNAVFSRHTVLSVHFKDDLNLGGTDVKEIDFKAKKWTNPNFRFNKLSARERARLQLNEAKQFQVDAICLDDLIPYLQPNRSVFLKMDIEGSEAKALECANEFFMKVDVQIVMMEFMFLKKSPNGKVIVDFLLRKNMLPASDLFGHNLLSSENVLRWPENVFWFKAR